MDSYGKVMLKFSVSILGTTNSKQKQYSLSFLNLVSDEMDFIRVSGDRKFKSIFAQ